MTLITALCLPVVFHFLNVILAVVAKDKGVTKRQYILIRIGIGTWVVLWVGAVIWALYVLVGDYFPMSRFMIILIVGGIVTTVIIFMYLRLLRKRFMGNAPTVETDSQGMFFTSNKYYDTFPHIYWRVLIVGIGIILIFFAVALGIELLVPSG